MSATPDTLAHPPATVSDTGAPPAPVSLAERVAELERELAQHRAVLAVIAPALPYVPLLVQFIENPPDLGFFGNRLGLGNLFATGD